MKFARNLLRSTNIKNQFGNTQTTRSFNYLPPVITAKLTSATRKYLGTTVIDASSGMNGQETHLAEMPDGAHPQDMDNAMITKMATVAIRQTLAQAHRIATNLPLAARKKFIAVIGGGITGQVMALLAADQGHQVTIYENYQAHDVSAMSATLGGSDIRHGSFTESMPFATKSRQGKIQKLLSEGGLTAEHPRTKTAKQWLEAIDANSYKPAMNDLRSELVIQMNKAGVRGWEEVFTQYPQLIENCQHKTNVIRLYMDKASFEAGITLQSAVNDRYRVLSKEDLVNHALGSHPGIYGGIEVEGFAIDILQLTKNMETLLRKKGVLYENKKITRIEDHYSGRVEVTHHSGETRYADQAVLATGAHTDLHTGTNLEGTIAMATGVFARIHNTLGLTEPVKLQFPDPHGVVNVRPDKHGHLVVSGEFAFALNKPFSPESAEGKLLFSSFETHVLKPFFAEGYQKAVADGSYRPSLCQRPMTADGMPIYEHVAKVGQRNNGRIFTAIGGNAAGFTQAPAAARLILDRLAGNENIITKALGLREGVSNKLSR